MGQQQILLIILGIVVIAIAVAIGISLFRAHAISSKRDILVNETIDMAAQAIGYYKRTREFGGGGKSFIGWQIPPQLQNTVNGSYAINALNKDEVVIIATGTELVTGSDSIQVKMTVNPDSYKTEVIH